MHQCEEFRERIAEHIIDRKDLAATHEFQSELLICSSCSEFYAESREMMDAISSVDFEIPEDHWDAMTDRLRVRLHAEAAVKRPAPRPAARRTPFFAQWRGLAAVAALLLITIGLYRIAIPQAVPAAPVAEYVYVDQTLPLDPVTVDFLEQSELLLRNVMKIEAADVEDMADAKRLASAQLAGIEQRKEAAAEVPPVLNVMDTYESVLRDIRNLNERNPAEDISDIQNRIQNNALIANMKAFQPTVSVVNVGLR